MEIKCKSCGKEFNNSKDIRRKYCSKKCAKQGWLKAVREAGRRYDSKKRGVLRFQGKCKHCGKAIRSRTNYCSEPDCRRAYMRKYIMKRYHTEEGFRKKMIESTIKSHRKSRNRKRNMEEKKNGKER